MTRYTTPTFTLTLPNDVDLTEATNVYATFSQPPVTLTKTGEALEITAHQIDVYLSQAETSSFASGVVEIQVNWTQNVSGEVRRACTEIARVNVGKNLLDEVVE